MAAMQLRQQRAARTGAASGSAPRHRRDPDASAATVGRTGALEAGAGAVPAAPEVWSSVEINQ